MGGSPLSSGVFKTHPAEDTVPRSLNKIFTHVSSFLYNGVVFRKKTINTRINKEGATYEI